MKTVITNHTGTQKSISIVPERKTFTAPKIIDSFMDDDGETMLVLENGNNQLKNIYDALWLPSKKTILPKNTKDKSVDPRVNYY